MEEPQHLIILKLANEIKSERAKIKQDVKNGKTTIPELARNPPRAIETMLVFDMVICMHGWKRHTTLRSFHRMALSEWTTFRSLTDRQRQLLVDEFSGEEA